MTKDNFVYKLDKLMAKNTFCSQLKYLQGLIENLNLN